MYCKKCEKSLPEGSTFCPYCGNESLEAEQPAVEETAAQPEAPEAPAQKAEVKKSGGKGVVAGILVFAIALLAVCVALLAVKLFGGETDLPGVTGDEAVTTKAPDATSAPNDGELFPMQYETVYPDGINYAELDITEYLTLGDYKGLTVTVTTSSEITDSDVKAFIDETLAAHSYSVDVTDRAAQLGDNVNIDFVGYFDGVAFDGGTAQGSELVLGSGTMIPGFEEGIVGMAIGEKKTIDATFPENYFTKEYAGKTAQFDITLNSIKVDEIPEYNDAFVRDNFDYDTTLQFEDYARKTLAEEREQEILAEKQNGILVQAVDNATVIKYPEGIVEDYMFQQIDQARFYGAMYYGMEYSEFIPAALGISAQEYEADVRKNAEAAVKQELVLFAIFKQENLTVDTAAKEEMLDMFYNEYGAEDIPSLCSVLGISEDYLNNTITFSVVLDQVMEFLTENTTFIGEE